MIRDRGLTVVPATVVDSGVLAALHAEAFAQSWSVDGFAAMQRSPGVVALLAWPRGAGQTDEPAGFILYRAVADEAEILTLAVRPAQRRRGIGAALVGAAAAQLGPAGARMLHLEVARDNEAALALYHACGFRETGQRGGYYAGSGPTVPRVDALLMSLDLG
ncbi:MAG: GNAT family N-acetyltransferase [Acetobacterales bacterium]